MTQGILHFAVNWPIAAAGDVYRAGKNAIPIPFIGSIAGAVLGTFTALVLLFFVGWVRGVLNYARSG